jgi:hypothetical protein
MSTDIQPFRIEILQADLDDVACTERNHGRSSVQ